MNKYIVRYTIHEEQRNDAEYMAHISNEAMKRGNGREFIEMIVGYQGDNFMRNEMTIYFIFKENESNPTNNNI